MEPLSWSVLEFEPKDRHPDWLWYVGLVFGIAATIAFYYSNIFFGIFLVIAGVSMILFAKRSPKILTISLGEKELIIAEEHIAYERIKQFWIDETQKPDKLLLLVKGSFTPILALPLDSVSAETVRIEMTKHAPEVLMHESLGIKIADRLGF
jgi:hypothetical protein